MIARAIRQPGPVAAGVALLVGALVLWTACSGGDGDGEDVADAGDAILTLDHIPTGYLTREGELVVGNAGASRMGVDFWLDRQPEEPGEVACITDGATVHRTEREAITDLERIVTNLLETGFSEVDAPGIGDQTRAVTSSPAKPVSCGGLLQVDTDIAYIAFRRGRVVGTVVVWVYEQGDPLDEAAALALMQLELIEEIEPRLPGQEG